MGLARRRRAGSRALALGVLLCAAAAATASAATMAASTKTKQKKPATQLQQAGAALPLAGLQTANNVAVVVYAPPNLSGQLKCEALVESIRSQGKWGGRLYLITEQLKCYQHERWTQCGLDAEIIALDDSFHEDDSSSSSSSGGGGASASSGAGAGVGTGAAASAGAAVAASTSPNPAHHRHGSLYHWWRGVLGPSALDVERARLVRSQLWQLLQPPAAVQALVYIHGCDQLVGAPLMPFIKQSLGAFKVKKGLFGAPRGPRPMLVVSPPAPPAPSALAASSLAADGGVFSSWGPFYESAMGQQQQRVTPALLAEVGEGGAQERRVGVLQPAAEEAQQQPQQPAAAAAEEEGGMSGVAVGRGAVWVLHRQHSAGLLQAWRETVREHHRQRAERKQQQQGSLRLASRAALQEGAHLLKNARQEEEEEERQLLETAVSKAWAKQQRQGGGGAAGAAGGDARRAEGDVCQRPGAACVARHVRRLDGWSRTLGCAAQEGCDMAVAPAVFNFVPPSVCSQYDHEMVADWVTTLDLCVVQDLGWCLPAHMMPFARGWLPYPMCAKMELGLSRVSCQWSCTEPTVVRSPGFRTSVIARTLNWP